MGAAIRIIATALLLTGCSSSDSPLPGPVTDSGVGATPAEDAATNSATPPAPTLDQVAKMTGSLHVMWTNPSGVDCTTIEGERKTATEPYKVVFTVPGSVDNKHDASANMSTTYTYRLRCKVGSTYSEYSNEKSGNPK